VKQWPCGRGNEITAAGQRTEAVAQLEAVSKQLHLQQHGFAPHKGTDAAQHQHGLQKHPGPQRHIVSDAETTSAHFLALLHDGIPSTAGVCLYVTFSPRRVSSGAIAFHGWLAGVVALVGGSAALPKIHDPSGLEGTPWIGSLYRHECLLLVHRRGEGFPNREVGFHLARYW